MPKSTNKSSNLNFLKARQVSEQIKELKNRTSARKSSTEAAENVGTKSAPFITEVIKSLLDSANSQVIQAAACKILGQGSRYANKATYTLRKSHLANIRKNITQDTANEQTFLSAG
jgi:hypothetical protein